MAKFVTVFCAVLLAYGAQCSIVSDLTADVVSIVDTAVDSAEALETSVNETMSSLIEAAETASANISSSISDAVSEWQEEVASVVNSTTTDIEQCTEQFSTAIEDVQSNATNCVTDVMQQSVSHAAEFTTEYTALKNYTESVSQKAAACAEIYEKNPNVFTLASATACVSALTVTAETEIAAQLAELTATTTSTVSSIVELQAQLEICEASVVVDSAEEVAEAAWESFETCVERLDS